MVSSIRHNKYINTSMRDLISKFDDYENLNLPICHCTIHGVTDKTYSKAHLYIDGTYITSIS